MLKFFWTFILLSISVSTHAVAGGTQAEQAACSRDVHRHCRQLIGQGDLTILACLQQHRPKISAACDQVLKSHGQ